MNLERLYDIVVARFLENDPTPSHHNPLENYKNAPPSVLPAALENNAPVSVLPPALRLVRPHRVVGAGAAPRKNGQRCAARVAA